MLAELNAGALVRAAVQARDSAFHRPAGQEGKVCELADDIWVKITGSGQGNSLKTYQRISVSTCQSNYKDLINKISKF